MLMCARLAPCSAGKHLSLSEVDDLVAPSPTHAAAVAGFLADAGVTDCSSSAKGGFVRCTCPVAVAEELLGATYLKFGHDATGAEVVRTLQYSLPEEVAAAVDFVAPTLRFPPVRKVRKVVGDVGASNATENGSGVGSGERRTNTPATLHQLYGPRGASGRSAPSPACCWPPSG